MVAIAHRQNCSFVGQGLPYLSLLAPPTLKGLRCRLDCQGGNLPTYSQAGKDPVVGCQIEANANKSPIVRVIRSNGAENTLKAVVFAPKALKRFE